MTKPYGKSGDMSELVSSLGWLEEEEDGSSQDGEQSPEMRGHHGLTLGSRIHSCTELGSEDMEEEEEEDEEAGDGDPTPQSQTHSRSPTPEENYIPDSPPISPVELKKELPKYLPALQVGANTCHPAKPHIIYGFVLV